ncbi:MAG: 30S ribosomal protein S16 [Armatimonadota bacterium]
MAVKIRLRRMGARGKPFYRLVVADSRSPRDGRFIEILGYYDPCTEPVTIKVDEEKALLWLGRGAQPTDTAAALLKKEAVYQKFLESKGAAAPAPAPVVEEAPKKRRTTKKAAAAEQPEVKAEAEVVAEPEVEPTEAQEETAEEQSTE